MSQINVYYRGDKEIEETYTLETFSYVTNKNGVAVATFNVPNKLNPLSLQNQWEILLITEHAKRDSQVKILVWTGKGRAFSSGMAFGVPCTIDQDIRDGYASRGVGLLGKADGALKGLVMTMLKFPKISICAVNGLAVGGAVNFALAGLHDLVYAAESAKFKYPFTSLALSPEIFSSYMMPRAMGLVTAKEIFFTERWWSSNEAKKYDLVNEVIPDDKLMEKVMDVATNLSKMGQTSLQLTKRLINSNLLKVKNANEIMDEENRTLIEATKSPEFEKALLAFQKRYTRKKPKL